MNSLVWIAKLYRTPITQYHIKHCWQAAYIPAYMMAGDRTTQQGTYFPRPSDQNSPWLIVCMPAPVCMKVCAAVKKTCHHVLALHLQEAPTLSQNLKP